MEQQIIQIDQEVHVCGIFGGSGTPLRGFPSLASFERAWLLSFSHSLSLFLNTRAFCSFILSHIYFFL
jgi:hypothetical protein